MDGKAKRKKLGSQKFSGAKQTIPIVNSTKVAALGTKQWHSHNLQHTTMLKPTLKRAQMSVEIKNLYLLPLLLHTIRQQFV